MKGFFLVLEGIDGAGTTTQAKLVREYLQAVDLPTVIVVTAEPTKGPVGAMIRQILSGRLKGPEGLRFDEKALALLFAADRLDHEANDLGPLLDAGLIVICDRYTMSSLAYQSLDMDKQWIIEINRMARLPDLTVLLDVDVETALNRIGHRGVSGDLYEEKAILERVRQNYLHEYEMLHPAHRLLLNGTRPVNVLASIIAEKAHAMWTARLQEGS